MASREKARPVIAPMPPIAVGAALPWDQAVGDAVAVISDARAAHGDSFVVDSGPDRYFFTFSPVGVANLYTLPEERASKGVADWRMLRRKLPDELFSGRRTYPHDLFGRDDAVQYMSNVHTALDAAVAELGDEGTIDLFALSRRLGHRVGLASWGGPGSSAAPRLDRLIAEFDALDGSDAFVHPDAMAAVTAQNKSDERAALAEVSALIGAAVALLDADRELASTHPLFARIVASWSTGHPSGESDERRTGVAHDVALIHVASMSNLFAAMGWALVDLFSDQGACERVRSGDRVWTEQCALESTRLAQRSIMSRYVLDEVALDDGVTVYRIPAGVTVATLLPLTNSTAAPGFERWEPDRWRRRRLADPSPLPAVELVTVFGHGKHTCPAQPFSLAAMVAVATRLLGEYDWVPAWGERPRPLAAQIGGVARSAGPCPVAYRRRATHDAGVGDRRQQAAAGTVRPNPSV